MWSYISSYLMITIIAILYENFELLVLECLAVQALSHSLERVLVAIGVQTLELPFFKRTPGVSDTAWPWNSISSMLTSSSTESRESV